MARSVMVCRRWNGGGAALLTAGNTYFFAVGDRLWQESTTEDDRSRTVIRAGGIFSNLAVRVTGNSLNGTTTVSSRLNGVDGNQSVSILTTVTGYFQDNTNTDSTVAGDKFGYKFALGGSSGRPTLTVVAMTFLPFALGNTVQILGSFEGNQSNFYSASSTAFLNLVGNSFPYSTESNAQYKAKLTGTLQNLATYITVNGRASSTTTLGTRKNTANGNCILSIPASSTGLFEDNSNTDSITTNDLLNYYVTTGSGTGAFAIFYLSSYFINQSNKFVMITCTVPTAFPGAAAYAPIGSWAVSDSVEANTQYLYRTLFTWSNLQAYVSGNDTISASTIEGRINAANGNQALSIGAAGTGLFEDNSNTDVLSTVNDTLNYRINPGGAGSFFQPEFIATVGSATPTNLSSQLPFMGVG